MSGHSKWATIHRQKEVKDAKRGIMFTKLGRAISVAVRAGRGVEEVVERARQYNMPKENINRAIERASGGERLEEAMFEGFLPGGAAVLIQTLSDNHLRAGQAVREVLERSGGTLGSTGSVSYMFVTNGELRIKNHSLNDELGLQIIDLGVENIVKDMDDWTIYCDPKKTSTIKEQIAALGCQIETSELIMRPNTLVEVDAETEAKIEAILAKLEDLDDVQKVYTNYN